MAIELPYSLELARDEDAISVLVDDNSDSVGGKMKIFIGANAAPLRPQSFVGTLKSVYRHLLNERVRSNPNETQVNVAYGHWSNASAGNISVGGSTAGITADDVAIVVSGTFAGAGATHFYQETFDQLIDVLVENTATGGTVAPPPP